MTQHKTPNFLALYTSNASQQKSQGAQQQTLSDQDQGRVLDFHGCWQCHDPSTDNACAVFCGKNELQGHFFFTLEHMVLAWLLIYLLLDFYQHSFKSSFLVVIHSIENSEVGYSNLVFVLISIFFKQVYLVYVFKTLDF
jgi:hypothetical protein